MSERQKEIDKIKDEIVKKSFQFSRYFPDREIIPVHDWENDLYSNPHFAIWEYELRQG